MSRSDACINVTCDRCGDVTQIDLAITALGYAEREITRQLEQEGWVVMITEDVCQNCVEEALRATRKEEPCSSD